MATINNFISLWITLGVVSLILASLRSDWQRLLMDIRMVLFKQKYYYSIGTLILIICLSPFSIPYSIKNIYNKHKNK
jgi:hypothetical protein